MPKVGLKDLPMAEILRFIRSRLDLGRDMFPAGSVPLTALDTDTGSIPYSALDIPLGSISPSLLSQGYYAVARRTTDQTINNNTITAVSFDSQVADTASMFTPTSTVINIVTSGIYLLAGNTYWGTAGSANTRMFTSLRLNGATFLAVDEDTASTTEQKGQNVMTIYPITAPATLDLVVFQTNAAATTRTLAVAGVTMPRLSALWLGY